MKDIEELHWKFGPDGLRSAIKKMPKEMQREFWEFRIRFLQEELDELKKSTDPADAVDALIDLCVVAVGTLDAFGVGTRTAWERVHKANMSKSVGANPSRPNKFGLPDLMKPEGWEPPDHSDNVGHIPIPL